MAQLEAQARMGYYAAEPEAIAELVKHLVPAGPSVFILDPCAGEGAAIKQIAESLGLPHENVHAIELDPGRGKAILRGDARRPGARAVLVLQHVHDARLVRSGVLQPALRSPARRRRP